MTLPDSLTPLSHFTFDSKESLDKLSEYLSLDDITDHVFWDILKYLKKYHDTKTIVIENSYIDKNYSNEFSNLYSKTFRSRKGYCKRLHFFKESSEDFNDFLTKFHNDELTYLGFLVNRPLAVGKVGSTTLLPKKMHNFYYLCSIKREVHLLGKTLKAEGIPFIEQDGMVMTCAQASIWIISNYMHYAYGIPRCLPFDITDKATSIFPHLGRAVPSAGLSLEQMTVAVSNIECFPLFRYKPRKNDYELEDKATYESELLLWQAIEKIYPYIESSIPVLIYSKNHVYTIVGYKVFDNIQDIDLEERIDILKDQEKKIKQINPEYSHTAILPASIFVDAFIVHDDQQGIYKLLPTGELPLKILQNNEDCNDLLYKESIIENGKKKHVYKDVQKDVEAVIIPLPEKIYILADEVFSIVKSLFSTDEEKFSLLDILIEQSDKGNKYADHMLSSSLISQKDPLVLRTYFINSYTFKESIQNNNDINPAIKDYYLSMDMPLLIWVVKISYFSLYGNHRKILGEVIVDSTANKYDSYGSILSIHLPGFFYQNKIITQSQVMNKEIPTEEPYDIFLRPQTDSCGIGTTETSCSIGELGHRESGSKTKVKNEQPQKKPGQDRIQKSFFKKIFKL